MPAGRDDVTATWAGQRGTVPKWILLVITSILKASGFSQLTTWTSTKRVSRVSPSQHRFITVDSARWTLLRTDCRSSITYVCFHAVYVCLYMYIVCTC